MEQSAIKQKDRETKRCTELMRSLLLGYRSWIEEGLRKEKLTLPQLKMLHAIEQMPDESAAAIARFCHVTPQTLQAMLERAVREKWIVRQHSERNLRVMTARLTPGGRALLRRAKELTASLETRLWTGVSVAMLAQSNNVLKKGVTNLEAALAEQVLMSSDGPKRSALKKACC